MQLVHRVDFIKSAVAGQKVLHLGCTNWPYTTEAIENDMLLHFALAKTAGELYGFDFDQAGIDTLVAAGGTKLFRADLERLEEVEVDETFDVIIAGEMIEHLNNPGLFLEGIKRFMSPDTSLVITTINAYCAMRFATYGLRGKGGENEPVHLDHVAYYSYRTLKLLVERAGFTVEQFCFYDIGPEHRPFNPWYLNLINDLAVNISPQLSDGVIAVCKLAK
ncbi:MAG: class I SAM-dependent methyltransferase [Acidobacteria bacterium]|nr:class I SAM-dependent methyltransferase [Acidobacteriota bacterium]MBK7935540.1 class I SAM-dependent methyltransferase [Acidobacteriota bacterium]